MPTIVRGGPLELISLAWYRIGFRPRESLVLVGLRGPRRRSGMVVRVDLPDSEHRASVLAAVVPMLRRAATDEVVVLVVSDVDGGPRAGEDGEVLIPHRDLVHWLERQLPRQGIGVFDTLVVGPDTFRSYDCDASCCPPEGRSLEELTTTEMSAHMVLGGRTVLDEESDLVADVQPDPVRRVSRRRLSRISRLDLPRQLRLWREALAAGAQEPAEPARLLVALRDVRLRDAVMFTLIPGSGVVPERVLGGDPGAADELLWDPRPDDDLLERGRRLLAALVRMAPPGDRVEVLAILAWLAWWANDAARCRLLTELALRDRPDHRLSLLVDQLLAAGISPTWWASEVLEA